MKFKDFQALIKHFLSRIYSKQISHFQIKVFKSNKCDQSPSLFKLVMYIFNNLIWFFSVKHQLKYDMQVDVNSIIYIFNKNLI